MKQVDGWRNLHQKASITLAVWGLGEYDKVKEQRECEGEKEKDEMKEGRGKIKNIWNCCVWPRRLSPCLCY